MSGASKTAWAGASPGPSNLEPGVIYRREAARLRSMANSDTFRYVRDGLLDVAQRYDVMAGEAEGLRHHTFRSPFTRPSRQQISTCDEQTAPIAQIVHWLPKRARLEVAEKRADDAFFAAAIKILSDAPGVTGVFANPATGSIAIEHSGDFDAVTATAARHGLFRPIPSAASAGSTSSWPLSLPSLIFAGLAAHQLSQGNVVGSALDALWNSYDAAVTLERPWLSAFLLGFGLYSLLNGQVLGSAVSLFFHSLSADHMARTRDRDAAAA